MPYYTYPTQKRQPMSHYPSSTCSSACVQSKVIPNTAQLNEWISATPPPSTGNPFDLGPSSRSTGAPLAAVRHPRGCQPGRYSTVTHLQPPTPWSSPTAKPRTPSCSTPLTPHGASHSRYASAIVYVRSVQPGRWHRPAAADCCIPGGGELGSWTGATWQRRRSCGRGTRIGAWSGWD